MQQTYKRTPMPKCVVNEVARHYWNCTSTWVFSCKFTAYIWKSFLQEHLREPVSVKDLYVWSNFVKVWVRYKRFFAVRVSTISIPITRWTSTWKGTKYDFLKRTIFPQREAAAQKGSEFISFGIELSIHDDKRKNEQTLGGLDAPKKELKILSACFKSV